MAIVVDANLLITLVGNDARGDLVSNGKREESRHRLSLRFYPKVRSLYGEV
jgi:hypothetical protein